MSENNIDNDSAVPRDYGVAVPPQQILAVNDAAESENRIHSDEIAARYGFRGALVSGVMVFGYLSQPLVRTYGADWLERGIMDVAFIKPAYEGELLNIKTESLGAESSRRNHLTSLYNEEQQLLAKLESWLPHPLPEIQEHFALSAAEPALENTDSISERPEISWDIIQLMTPAPVFTWRPDAADNAARVALQQDQSALYRGDDAYLHPYYILQTCNKALMKMYVMPAWIHTGSKLTVRRALRVGQTIEVRTLPIAKWEHRGHQFIKLYIAMSVDGEVALEVEHSAIFRIAG